MPAPRKTSHFFKTHGQGVQTRLDKLPPKILTFKEELYSRDQIDPMPVFTRVQVFTRAARAQGCELEQADPMQCLWVAQPRGVYVAVRACWQGDFDGPIEEALLTTYTRWLTFSKSVRFAHYSIS